MTGISRKHIYAIMIGANLSADYCRLLTPLIHDIGAGKIAVRAGTAPGRTGGR
jgi:hypothetical protein